jgi:hypothetical protein
MLSCEHWTFAEISEATYRLESCEMQWCNSCCTSHVLRVRISLMILCALPSFWRWGCCLSCFGVLSDLMAWLKDGILWLQSVRQRWRSCQKVNCGISEGSSHRKQRGLIIFYLMKHNFLSWDSEWGVREKGCQIPDNGMLLFTLQQFAWWPCKSVMLSSDVKFSFALFVVGRLPLQICQTFFLFRYCYCSFSSKSNEAHIWRSW